MAAYYFDGSGAAITDPNGVWTSGSNAIDGSLATKATTASSAATGGAAGVTSNYLKVEGTNVPSSGSPIISVKARVYADDSDTTADWGPYLLLPAPSGGWSWPKVQTLETRIAYVDTGLKNNMRAYITTDAEAELLGTFAVRDTGSDATGTPFGIYKVELEVLTASQSGNQISFVRVGNGMSRSEVAN